LRLNHDLGGQALEVPQAVALEVDRLPGPSRGQPLLLAGLAVAAVVGLIVLIDAAGPSGTPNLPTGEVRGPDTRDKDEGPRPGGVEGPRVPGEKGPGVAPAPVTEAVYVPPTEGPATADHLADWLEKNRDVA